MTDSDPLKHADVGEKATFEDTITLHGYDLEPDGLFGSDRETLSVDVTDITEQPAEGDSPYNDIEITVEAQGIKTLPRRWDYTKEPITERQERAERKRTWVRRIGEALSFFLPIALVFGLMSLIMPRVMRGMSEVTINGKAVNPQPGMYLFAVAFVFVMSATIYVYMTYGPRRSI